MMTLGSLVGFIECESTTGWTNGKRTYDALPALTAGGRERSSALRAVRFRACGAEDAAGAADAHAGRAEARRLRAEVSARVDRLPRRHGHATRHGHVASLRGARLVFRYRLRAGHDARDIRVFFVPSVGGTICLVVRPGLTPGGLLLLLLALGLLA